MSRLLPTPARLVVLLCCLAVPASLQAQEDGGTPTVPASVDHDPTHEDWIVNESMADYPYPNYHVTDGNDLGGTLRRGIGSDPDNLNPVTASNTTTTLLESFTYEPLASTDPRDAGAFIPRLAEWWESSPDHMTYLVHLRRGVMWHPVDLPGGETLEPQEMTADDVVFHYRVVMNEVVQGAHLRSYYSRIDSVEAVDRYTVRVTWGEPYFRSLDWTLFMTPLPRHVFGVDAEGSSLGDPSSDEFGQAFNQHWMNQKICGTGPYRLDAWERGQHFILERNPDYWGAPGHFDRIRLRVINDENTRFLLFQNGELDFSPLTVEQFVNQSEGGAWAAGELHKQAYYSPGYRYMGYNLRKPMFQDALTRRALSHAIPRDAIIQNVMEGLAEVTTGPFYKFSAPYDSSVEPLEHDPGQAEMLLYEAGWEDSNGDGVLDRVVEGERVDFEFDLMIYASSSTYENIGVIIQQALGDLGIEVTVSPVQWATFLQSLDSRDFDACILGWSMGISGSHKPDPKQVWWSDYADQEGSSNFVGWRNDRTDEIIRQIRVTFDDEERNALYHEFHRILHEAQPYTFLFIDMSTVAWNDRLRGVEFFSTGAYEWRDWYIPSDLQD